MLQTKHLKSSRVRMMVAGVRFTPSARLYHVQRTPPPLSTQTASLLHTSLQTRPVPLSKLTAYGDNLSPASVLESAALVLDELPRRLAHRVRKWGGLPFIVGTNPFIARIHKLYQSSFEAIATYPAVTDLDSNWKFTRYLEGLVEAHSSDIPTMAKGFQECAKYMSPQAVTAFLDEAIRSRIAVRLIAEQHIAITRHFQSGSTAKDVGIIHKETSPAEMIKMCASFVSELCEASLGSSPRLILEGKVDATFPYVPVHLEYIMTEILKNSFRATVEYHANASGELPPVVITIAPSIHPPTPARPSYMALRVRDQGGGISPVNMERIFSYAYTTAGSDGASQSEDEGMGGGPYAAQHVGGIAALGGDTGAGESNLFGEITGKGLQTGLGSIAGLGYGLPLARLYASYFGAGSGLELVSMNRFGTDVFIKLRCLDLGGGEVLI